MKKKVLIIGARGFIGRNLAAKLEGQYQVVAASSGDALTVKVDLSDPSSIRTALANAQADYIVNCAGVAQNTAKAELNVTYTCNLMQEIIRSGQNPQRVVILGSAGEYGAVKDEELPVSEDVPLRAQSRYGVSKIREVEEALKFRFQHAIPVVVARVFNPIGLGMPSHQLVPSIMRQVQQVKAGERAAIEVHRIDSERDYVDVRDVAGAVGALLAGAPSHCVYNVGSGRATSNGELVRMILDRSAGCSGTQVREISPLKEPQFASAANIRLIKDDLGWEPMYSLEQAIENILYEHS